MTLSLWKKTFSAIASEDGFVMKGKLSVEFQREEWVGTARPCVLILPACSSFYEGLLGKLRIHALTSLLKAHIGIALTILVKGPMQEGLALIERFEPFFRDCLVKFWDVYVAEDLVYGLWRKEVLALEVGEKKLDSALIEECAGHLVLASKGYRFVFCIEPITKGLEEVLRTMLPPEQQMTYVNVGLEVQSKVVKPLVPVE